MHFYQRNLFIVGIILLLNILLKYLFIDSIPLDGDEPFTLFYSKVNSAEFWEMMKTENNPPLYFLLQRLWVNVFSDGLVVIRIPSFIFSVLSGYLLFQLRKEYFSKAIGVSVALIFTFSTYHMLFSHENRAYSLFGLLTILSYYLFLKFLEKKVNLSFIIISVVVNSILMYTHFFGFFVLFTQLCIVLLFRSYRREKIKQFVIIGFGVLILFSPYIYLTVSRFSEASSGTWLQTPSLVELYNQLWHFSNKPLVTVLFMAGLLIAIIQFIRNKLNRMEEIIVVSFILPYLLMFVLSFKIPMFLDRYLVFVSFSFYFSSLIGFQSILKNEKLKFAIYSLFPILMMITFNPSKEHTTQTKQITDYLVENKRTYQTIYIHPAYLKLAISYHIDNQSFNEGVSIDSSLNRNGIYPFYSPSEIVFKDNSILVSMGEINSLNSIAIKNSGLTVVPQFKAGSYVLYDIQRIN